MSRKRSLDGAVRARRQESVRVEGRRGCFNDVYLSLASDARANVVFFPGDVQHFDHVMRRGDFKAYSAFSYESVCDHYARRFPDANVWVVKPFSHAKGVSCYDNFVDHVDGDPTQYAVDGPAFMHLQLLMERASALFPGDLTWSLPLHLHGFSRGAVVLNQLITELGSLLHRPPSPTHVDATWEDLADGSSISAFFDRVESIEWIDGGCNARGLAYPSHDTALVLLNAFRHISLRVLVTPYHYAHRPWYAADLAQFQTECQHVELTQHFMDDAPSLQNHFEVLFVH
ncbi:Aste57867_9501 [Aphanomyces stellatus]|uniref:Aste57867_9501 protein n=1 Tax=Aphanomyces stellatus TaxID=120398 RepID=A0A485KNH0_9STRA|nr:hypothetical protein As57867_009464 [Aphanomyces stellatus]VFT86380.1 Aste57867_9501 [Aphanomyces stellatus]